MRSCSCHASNEIQPRTARLLWLREILRDAEDHKFCRTHYCHSDLCCDPPQVAVLRWIGIGIALHIERLLLRFTEKCAVMPHHGQECGDAADDLGPKCLIVGLENNPLRAF